MVSYDNPISTRFLAPTGCSKIPAQSFGAAERPTFETLDPFEFQQAKFLFSNNGKR